MLLENAAVVDIPTRAVKEIQVVRHFDEPDTAFAKPPSEQAPLPKLAAVPITKIGRFFIEMKAPHEFGTAELEALLNRRVVILQACVADLGLCVLNLGQKLFAAGLTFDVNAIRPRKPRRSASGICQIKVTVPRAEKARPREALG